MPITEPIEPLRTSSLFDSSKIPCKDHTGQSIINFCLNPQCMIGLCSNCICTHTDMHVKNATIPQYQSIKQLKNNVAQEMTDYLKIYSESKERINALASSGEALKKQIKQIILVAKQDVYDIVDQTFQYLRKQFQEDIQARRKIAGVHTVSELESLSKKIGKKMRQILEEGQEMNSMMRFLENAKKFKTQGRIECEKFRESIDAEISVDQGFNSDLRYSKERLQDIGVIIKKMFSLQFKYAKVPQKSVCRSSSPMTLSNSSQLINMKKSLIKNSPLLEQRPSSIMKTSVRNSSSAAFPPYFSNLTKKTENPHRMSQQQPTHSKQGSDLSNSTVINTQLAQTMPLDDNESYLNNFRNILSMNDNKTSEKNNKLSGLRLSNSFTGSQLMDMYKASLKENQY